MDKIQTDFKAELAPDPAGGLYVPLLHKEIARVGRYNSSALVIIEGAEHDRLDPSMDFFRAFTYDLETGKKTQVGDGFRSLHLEETQARFDRSVIPDLIFRYQSCTECEATYLLTSFRYDSATRLWNIRPWGSKDEDKAIFIGYDGVPNGDSPAYVCASRIRDFKGGGFESVGVWCRIIPDPPGKETEIAYLYYVDSQQGKNVEIKDQPLLTAIHSAVCEQSGEKPFGLCSVKKKL
jgi:hypothetical protein